MSPLRRLLLVAVLALPCQAAAQGAVERDFLAWADSVAAATTREVVEALSRSPDGAGQGWLLIRRGVVAANWSDVESGTRLLVAERSARRESPLATYLLARTFHDLAIARAPVRSNVAQRDGESNAEAYWRLQRGLVERYPNFVRGQQLATEALVAIGDRLLRDDQLAILKVLRGRAPTDPALELVEGRRLRTAGQFRQALAAFDHAIALGADRGVLAIERARTLAALNDLGAAARAYWSGTSAMTNAGRAAYRMDLAWFVHPDTIAPFDRVPLDSVTPWLTAFWAERDALAANAPGERLQEQLRRWAVAFRSYRIPMPWRRTQFARVEYLFEELDLCLTAIGRGLYDELARLQPSDPADSRSTEPLLDHRGLVVLRHGSPVRRVIGKATIAPVNEVPLEYLSGEKKALAIRAQATRVSMRFNETWLYWLDGRWRVFSFRGSDALGHHGATTLMSYLPLADAMGFRFTDDWELRAVVSDEFARAAARMRQVGDARGLACDETIGLAVTRQREDATVGIATDSDAPPISDPWPAAMQVYALGHDDGTGKALVALALPGDRLTATRLPDGRLDHPVQIRVTAYRKEGGRLVTLDTLAHYVTRDTLRRGTFINQLFEIPLAAGRWQVAVKLMQTVDTTGAYAVLPALTIGGASRVSLSDIVLGRERGAAWTTPGGDRFPVNTLGTWSRSDEAAIYYELYGAQSGDTLRTRIEVRSLAEGRETDRVTASFREVATGGTIRTERRLGLSQLRGGQYDVIVTIETPAGTVSRRQRLIVTVP